LPLYNKDIGETLTEVHIYPKNKIPPPDESGPIFPETGGSGITIFNICGGLLVFCSFTSLMVRSKMSAIKKRKQTIES